MVRVPVMTQVNSMSRAHITSPSLVERIAITHERMIEDIFREMHDLKGPPYAPPHECRCVSAGRLFWAAFPPARQLSGSWCSGAR